MSSTPHKSHKSIYQSDPSGTTPIETILNSYNVKIVVPKNNNDDLMFELGSYHKTRENEQLMQCMSSPASKQGTCNQKYNTKATMLLKGRELTRIQLVLDHGVGPKE